MRRNARVDANQQKIVQALEAAGCVVQSLAQLGRGVPDILVGRHGRNYLLAIKDGDKVPSARKLTPDEIAWHRKWKGQIAVAETEQQALDLVLSEPGENKGGLKNYE